MTDETPARTSGEQDLSALEDKWLTDPWIDELTAETEISSSNAKRAVHALSGWICKEIIFDGIGGLSEVRLNGRAYHAPINAADFVRLMDDLITRQAMVKLVKNYGPNADEAAVELAKLLVTKYATKRPKS